MSREHHRSTENAGVTAGTATSAGGARAGADGAVAAAATILLALLLVPFAALAQDVTFTVEGASPAPTAAALWAFWIIGGLIVAGAVATITRRNPVVAAVCLVATLGASAGLYVLLHATFLAAMQVLVYAGAIMVLFVFVVMAVEKPEQEETGMLRGTVTKIVGVIALALLLFRVITVVMGPAIKKAGIVSDELGTVSTIGRLLFSDFLFPFEAISILLLVSIVGAVVVSRRRASAAAEGSEDGAVALVEGASASGAGAGSGGGGSAASPATNVRER